MWCNCANEDREIDAKAGQGLLGQKVDKECRYAYH